MNFFLNVQMILTVKLRWFRSIKANNVNGKQAKMKRIEIEPYINHRIFLLVNNKNFKRKLFLTKNKKILSIQKVKNEKEKFVVGHVTFFPLSLSLFSFSKLKQFSRDLEIFKYLQIAKLKKNSNKYKWVAF